MALRKKQIPRATRDHSKLYRNLGWNASHNKNQVQEAVIKQFDKPSVYFDDQTHGDHNDTQSENAASDPLLEFWHDTENQNTASEPLLEFWHP